jgi:DNA mismatch endonuclease (patch repair protein)
MTDLVSQAKRSEMMRAVKGVWTKPELSVQRLLRRLGYRPLTHVADLPGKPDFVLPNKRKIILVHGCFWHRHRCVYATTPKSRRAYWTTKFEENIRRDRRNHRALKRLGWAVFVVWQCRLRREDQMLNELRRFLSDDCKR